MNKAELIAEISEKSGISKSDSEKVLSSYIEIIKDTLNDGEKVCIYGFGTYESVERASREGRNPSTGEKLTIAACKFPKFKPAPAFKEFLN